MRRHILVLISGLCLAVTAVAQDSPAALTTITRTPRTSGPQPAPRITWLAATIYSIRR